MRPQPPIQRIKTVVGGYGETATAWTEKYYEAESVDRYIASLKRRGIRGWQEARKLRTFRAAYGHAIAQVQDTAFQLGRTESERDEAVALIKRLIGLIGESVPVNEVMAFLTRIGGAE